MILLWLIIWPKVSLPFDKYNFPLTQVVFGTSPVTGRPAVNVGSRQHPIWYAQEHLRIVPYQPYTRPVPDQYTSSMVDEACRDPEISRAYIENEGLRSLGFTTSGDSFSFVSTKIHFERSSTDMTIGKYSSSTPSDHASGPAIGASLPHSDLSTKERLYCSSNEYFSLEMASGRWLEILHNDTSSSQLHHHRGSAL